LKGIEWPLVAQSGHTPKLTTMNRFVTQLPVCGHWPIRTPQIGTIRMWARNPPIPLNFALGNPNKPACFEHLARNRIWLLPDGPSLKEGFNGDGAVVSYLNSIGDNDGTHGNSISGVRAVQHLRICPDSHGSHARTDPIHPAPSVVSHPNQGSP
jgi:hypothetical protein